MSLSAAQRAAFEAFGYLHLPGVLTTRVDWLTAELEAVFAHFADTRERVQVAPICEQTDRLLGLLTDPALVALATSLLGPDYNYVGGDANLFHGTTPWHADAQRELAGLKTLKIAIYLDPLTRHSGALQLFPGSHRLDDSFARHLHAELHGLRFDGYAAFAERYALPVETRPGDLVVFDHKILHGARNAGFRRRQIAINLTERARTPAQIHTLRTYIGRHMAPFRAPGSPSVYTPRLLAAATPELHVHLEQVLAEEHAASPPGPPLNEASAAKASYAAQDSYAAQKPHTPTPSAGAYAAGDTYAAEEPHKLHTSAGGHAAGDTYGAEEPHKPRKSAGGHAAGDTYAAEEPHKPRTSAVGYAAGDTYAAEEPHKPRKSAGGYEAGDTYYAAEGPHKPRTLAGGHAAGDTYAAEEPHKPRTSAGGDAAGDTYAADEPHEPRTLAGGYAAGDTYAAEEPHKARTSAGGDAAEDTYGAHKPHRSRSEAYAAETRHKPPPSEVSAGDMPDEVALDAALVARAAHSRSAPFRDPYAAKLAGARGAALAERFIAQFGDPSDWIAARVAAFDALVREVAGRGEVGQVLLFGASTRPLRVATPDVRVFEVDRPEAFEARRERGVAPEGTVEIAAWLGDPGLVGAIGASGFAPVLPALVLLEGVADRVDEAALEALLRGFAQHGHGESRVAFDYSSAGLDGEALCRRAGFRHVRRVSFDQAWLALEGAWDPQRGFRERAFVVASRNAPVVRDD